ncbi:MAG: hypothetical protein HY806_08335 [Nitrospirae bacterium]|nr:hypothetical protein [Nitrospirota bacterium]
MCPKFKDSICEVAGLESEYIECADKNCCYSSSFETCKLYLLEALMECSESLSLAA